MKKIRWKRVEEHLIAEGYVCKDTSKDLRVWVDCISHGRDIQYSCHNLLNTEARFRGSPDAQYIDPVFEVMYTKGPTPNNTYAASHTLLGAIATSRNQPAWW